MIHRITQYLLKERPQAAALFFGVLTACFGVWAYHFFLVSDARADGAVYVVDTTADGTASAGDCENGTPSGNDCSLRDALTAANATTTATTINFTIPTNDANYYCYSSTSSEINIAVSGSGGCSGSTRWWKISPTSTLPTITANSLTINGYSQTGASASASVIGSDAVVNIQIDGTSAGSSGTVNGLTVTATSVTIKGLAITAFYSDGIRVTSGSATIHGNYIGADVTGLLDKGNSGRGIFVDTSTSTVIGGTSAGTGNLISGNGGDGIEATTGATIQGNYIGVKISGSAALANSSRGIAVSASSTIGGTSASARNIISGNTGRGIEMTGASNTVQGNYIGLGADGSTAVGNGSDGVNITAGSNTIGGTASGAGNIISGNTSNGIRVAGASATDNFIQGNYIGTNAAGTSAKTNGVAGIALVSSSSNTTVGGASSGARNVISGNTTAGIDITTSAASSTILGNYIGLNAAGTGAVGNDTGIQLDTASTITIGGASSGEGNVISGNEEGISITASTGIAIMGNYIGVDAAGTSEVANTNIGISTGSGAMSGVTIGGDTSAKGNRIRGNGNYGVACYSTTNAGSVTSTVQHNSIFDNTTDQIALLAAGCTNMTFASNTVGNASVATNILPMFVASYSTFNAGSTVYNGCGGSSGCLFYVDTSLGSGSASIVTVTSNNTAMRAADGVASFHLWMGTLSGASGEYFSVFVRSDQFSTGASVATYLTANLGLGTATTDYFESGVLSPGPSSSSSYVFKGISNFSTQNISVTSGTATPSLAYGNNIYYGYRIQAATANTFTNETCVNIGNCFLFEISSAASFTVTESTLTSVAFTAFKTSGSAAVNLTIQDTPVATSAITRGASGGTISHKFYTRGYVTNSAGTAADAVTISLKNAHGTTLTTLTSGSDGYTPYFNATTYSMDGTDTINHNALTFSATDSRYGSASSAYTLDTKNETVTLTLATTPAPIAPAPPAPVTPAEPGAPSGPEGEAAPENQTELPTTETASTTPMEEPDTIPPDTTPRAVQIVRVFPGDRSHLPVIEGTAEALANLTLTYARAPGGSTFGTASTLPDNGSYPVPVDSAGTWSLRLPDYLRAGSYEVTALAIDASGNTASDRATMVVTDDPAGEDGVPNGSVVIREKNAKGFVKTRRLTLRVTAVNTAFLTFEEMPIQIPDESGAVASTTQLYGLEDVGPQKIFVLPSGDGVRCIRTTLVSLRKQWYTTRSACVTLDTVRPAPPILGQILPGADSTLTPVSGTAEPYSLVRVRYAKVSDAQIGRRPVRLAGRFLPAWFRLAALETGEATATADSSGEWTTALPLSPGRYEISATAEDQAGNVSENSPALAVTMNATAPPEPSGDGTAPSEGTAPSSETPPEGTAPASPSPGAGETGVGQTGGGTAPPTPITPGARVPESSSEKETSALEKTITAVKGSVLVVQNGVEAVQKRLQPVREVLQEPVVQEANQFVVVPVTAAAVVATAASQLPQAVLFLRYLFLQPLLLFRRRRYKRWGTVCNAFTKQPVDLAIVRLLDAATGTVSQTCVTDARGRYFFIARPGTYRLEATRQGFVDMKGEEFTITDASAEIRYTIGLEPVGEDRPAAAIIREHAARGTRWAVGCTGLAVSLLSFFITPTFLTAGFIVLHVTLFVFFSRVSRRRLPPSYGVVSGAESGRALSRAVVRLFDVASNKLVDTAVTDGKGRYGFLVGNRAYAAAYEKEGYEPKRGQVWDFSGQEAEGGLISGDEKLSKTAPV